MAGRWHRRWLALPRLTELARLPTLTLLAFMPHQRLALARLELLLLIACDDLRRTMDVLRPRRLTV